MSWSQLLNSPKLRTLSTKSDLWLWFVLQQVRPAMLQQSYSSSSCPTGLVASYPQHHFQNLTGTADICSLRDTSDAVHTAGEPQVSPAPSQRAGCYSLGFPVGVNQQESFQGKQSHKELCRFTQG